MEKRFQEIFKNLRKAFLEMAEMLKRIFDNDEKAFKNIEREKEHRKIWYVPRKIIMEHQVLIRKPIHTKIRSNL